MDAVDLELALVALGAMLSPTTLIFSVLALVLAEKPRRTGIWFYLGAFTATIAVGIIAAFVIGDVATSHKSSPKTWVAIVDLVLAVLLTAWAVRAWRRPVAPEKLESMVGQMRRVASSPAVAVVGAGAALANPGAFIPIALKDISESDPSTWVYVVKWVFFTIVALLPLAVAIVMLFVARERTEGILVTVRDWLMRNAMRVAGAIVALLALSLLRNGIAGLTS